MQDTLLRPQEEAGGEKFGTCLTVPGRIIKAMGGAPTKAPECRFFTRQNVSGGSTWGVGGGGGKGSVLNSRKSIGGRNRAGS